MLVLPALAISFLFPPETSSFRNHRLDFRLWLCDVFTALYRLDINQQFRRSTRHLERLKATISLWQQITLYSGAGYLAFVIFLVSVASTVAKVMIRDEYKGAVLSGKYGGCSNHALFGFHRDRSSQSSSENHAVLYKENYRHVTSNESELPTHVIDWLTITTRRDAPLDRRTPVSRLTSP